MTRLTTSALLLIALAACGDPTQPREDVSAAVDTIPRLTVERDDIIAGLDSLDREAHARQIEHHLARSAEKPADASDYLEAEGTLSAELVRAWRAIPAQESSAAYLVDAPLLLAALDLQIELRRFLGPNFHTRVPDLREDPGCAGDVIQDRLVWRYGAAAQSIAATAGPDHPTVDPLNRWAHQMVCLSDAQLAQLDYALDAAYESVTGRMRHRGLERLIAPFAREMAPLELLLLDVRKHRGTASRAWHWFARHQKVLAPALSRAGWVGGDVLVWNRRMGVLVGFGPCRGRTGGDCVDMDVLLETIGDARALGLGQCGLASMISTGATSLPATGGVFAAGPRYVCPMTACEPSVSGTTLVPEPTTTEQRQRLAAIWPQLDAAGTQAAAGLCAARGLDQQGTTFPVQGCLEHEFDSLFESQNNPFDNYLACTMAAIGADQLPDVGTAPALTGVPMGRQTSCGALAEGGARTSSNAPPIGSQPLPKVDKIATARDATGKATAFTYMFTASDGTIYIVNSSGAGVITVARVPTPADPRPTQVVPLPTVGNNSPIVGEAAATGSILQQVNQERPTEAGTAKVLLDQAYFDSSGADWVVVSSNGVDRYENSTSNGGQACFDVLSCRDDCTALGRLLSATEACTAGMVDAMSAALGRPAREVTRGRERVSHPRPDDFDVEKHNFGACFATAQSSSPSACGLVVCGGGALATPTTGPGPSGCVCGGPQGPRVANTSLCQRIRCADGVPPDPSTCGCEPPEPVSELPSGDPVPPPSTWSLATTPQTLDACAATTPGVYDWSHDPRSIVGRDGIAMWDR